MKWKPLNPDGQDFEVTFVYEADEVQRLREALAFYADASLYEDGYACCGSQGSSAEEDGGKTARAALGIPEYTLLPPLPKMFRGNKVDCVTGEHRYHFSYDAARECQRKRTPKFAERFRRFQEACDALA